MCLSRKITIRGDHNYVIEINEYEEITNRYHVSSSWIESEYKQMSSQYKQQYMITCKRSLIQSKNGEMISDILCIN